MSSRFIAICLISIVIFVCQAQAQTYEKIADQTISYVKAGTFGKPSVAKKTNKLALAHVRVHFKFITTQAVETRNNSAKVTVYLDGAMTDADLQNLTDEFYAVLQKKLAALGIESVDWPAIQATEYYQNRQAATEEKKRTDGDAKNGQAWLSYTAFDGPVFHRFNPVSGYPTELLAFGKIKKLANMSETLDAEIAVFDAVVDFTSINMQTKVGTVWEKDGVYTEYSAGGSVGEIMSVPQSYALFFDRKNGFDQYQSKLPVAVRGNFANRIYEDDGKAALKTRTFFGDTRFTFRPRVIEVDRARYLSMARRALEQYADLFVEKMRQIRGGEKPSDAKTVAEKPKDTTTMKQVVEEAKKNNDTTPVTTGELTEAAEQAVKESKFQLAADYYGALIKLNPNEYENYLKRGVLYLNELKNAREAIKDFTTAMELNSDNLILPFNRGTAYIQTSDWKKAKVDFDRVISLRPDFVNAYLNRGIVLLNMKKYDEAIADFNTGLRLAPNYPNLYRARAVAFSQKGENRLAQADELRAAQLERGQ
jgi:tetratricopeptide (TPR) repeat protein